MTIIKPEHLFIVASLQDTLNSLFTKDLEIDFVLLIMALVASSVGSFVRVAHENQKNKVGFARFFFMYMCSICVSYIAYEVTTNYGYTKLLGVIALVSGIISIDIITFIIEDLPTILKKTLQLIINSKVNQNNNGSKP